jgi:hypothetical protein
LLAPRGSTASWRLALADIAVSLMHRHLAQTDLRGRREHG